MDDQQNLTALGIASYEAALRSIDGFRERPGQRAMVVAVARAFAAAGVGDDSEQPSRAIAVIQAGTGVGKSAAYITAGIAVAKAQKKRLVLSTSTTSLQEQLVSKDLPALAAAAMEPFTYALAKGRGRYVCKLKLMRRAGADAASQDTLELENESSLQQQATVTDSRVVFYHSLADALQTGWDGDRDSLPEGTQAEAWGTVAADRHTCTARACSHYSSCSYYLARRKLAGVDLIVANHDLVLASIGARTLPELEDAYWVFDEGHHLGEKAVEQFASSMDLTRLRWLEKLPRALASVASELQVPIKIDLDRVCHELKATLADMSRIVWDAFASDMNGRDSSRRLSDTEVESFLGQPLRLVSAHANDLSALAVTLGDELRARMKEEPGSNARWSALYVAVGSYAPRITETQHAADMLLSEDEEARTTAKWCSAEVNGSYIGLQLQACPILPGDLLRYHLWPRIRGAVVTSATLQSCGSWDYVLSELGLENDPAEPHQGLHAHHVPGVHAQPAGGCRCTSCAWCQESHPAGIALLTSCAFLIGVTIIVLFLGETQPLRDDAGAGHPRHGRPFAMSAFRLAAWAKRCSSTSAGGVRWKSWRSRWTRAAGNWSPASAEGGRVPL